MPGIIKLQLHTTMQLVRIIRGVYAVTGLERGVAACVYCLVPTNLREAVSFRHRPVITEVELQTCHNGDQVAKDGTVLEELISFFCF